MPKRNNPVEELGDVEDLAAKMELAGIGVDSNTMLVCYMNGLPKSEYEQEIRDIGLIKTFNRDEIIRLVRNRYEILTTAKARRCYRACMRSPAKNKGMTVAVVADVASQVGGVVDVGQMKMGRWNRRHAGGAGRRGTTATIVQPNSAKDVVVGGTKKASVRLRQTCRRT